MPAAVPSHLAIDVRTVLDTPILEGVSAPVRLATPVLEAGE